MQRHPHGQHLLRGTAAAAVLSLTLVGCSSGGGSSEGGASSGVAGERADAASAALDSGFAAGRTRPQRQGAQSSTTQVGLLTRDVIQHAAMAVRTENVSAALGRVRALVAAAQGLVADEHTEIGLRGGARRSTLTLRVPAPAFAATLADIGRLGRVTTQEVSTEDVSVEVVDVEARILSAERTLERIRELLDRATDFSDVLSLEAELARREADLASLKAQQAYLEDQTSLSTIVLSLLPKKVAPQPQPDDEPAGFVAGLDTGWDALVALVTVVLTALGVVVPLLLVLAPAGLLVWWGVRRARRQPWRQPAEQPAP